MLPIVQLLASLLALAGITPSSTSQSDNKAKADAAQSALVAASGTPTSDRITAN
jgi:hypothetical protein